MASSLLNFCLPLCLWRACDDRIDVPHYKLYPILCVPHHHHHHQQPINSSSELARHKSKFLTITIKTASDHKRSTASKTLNASELGSTGGQGGYATNFGGGLSGGAESQVIAAVFKTLVTRFVGAFKELKGNENIALYCDVRQLINYVKGAHGGPFRRTALSGIMAVTPRPNKKSPNLQTTRVIRHLQPGETQLFQSDEKSSRKILFKKRSTSSACPVSKL